MKRLLAPAGLLILILILILASVFVLRPDGAALEAQGGELWQTGKCYRVFPHDRDQFYGFKILEPPKGGWVRALPDPPPMQSPGMRPSAPFWLNTGSLFGVQEWPCTERP